jgi:hypothetical protein
MLSSIPLKRTAGRVRTVVPKMLKQKAFAHQTSLNGVLDVGTGHRRLGLPKAPLARDYPTGYQERNA